ncbi:hypothetical protein AYJ54_00610 [Bradyrhizobium centrolobii]|uniref:Uncharacterized protein n=1 Tax=Bradyrhizobium centrolobii TaxID=1505087 RepID=A0A176YGX0_9BRAD|nr:hypothetical protein [Bradyrhizobium centrolobii]OAF05440.1 hypothetical protein AYJ54_00610 [Bradyrhizobium centrolobii]
MLEKLSKMCVRQAMIDVAGSPPGYGEQPRWLTAVAKQIGTSYRTARSLWLGEIDDPDHWAAKAVKREAAIAKAKREAAELAKQFENLAGKLNAKHQDIYSADVAALLDAARVIRGLDRT